jgi:hypothetical protein
MAIIITVVCSNHSFSDVILLHKNFVAVRCIGEVYVLPFHLLQIPSHHL